MIDGWEPMTAGWVIPGGTLPTWTWVPGIALRVDGLRSHQSDHRNGPGEDSDDGYWVTVGKAPAPGL